MPDIDQPKRSGDKRPVLPPDVTRKLLDNQAAALRNQEAELELRKINEQNSHEYAKQALEVHKEDRQQERRYDSELFNKLFYFVSAILMLIAVFVGYCLYTNKLVILEKLLDIMLKHVLPLVSAFLIGRFTKGKNTTDGGED